MIAWPLMKREIKANYKIWLLFLAVVTLYSTVVVTMYDPKLGESLNLMAQSMPQMFEAFGMSNPGATLLEFVSNYLYGFILLVIPIIFIILLSHRLIVRYVDRGSMAYLLATPNTRKKVILTQALVVGLALLTLVLYTMVLIMICSSLMFSESIDVSAFLLLNAGWLGLLVLLGGMGFLSACIFNETKLATGVGAGLSILFILLQMLSQAGDKLDALKYATPLTLFQPEALLRSDGGAILCFMSLYVAGIVMVVLGTIVFKRKDIAL